MAPSSRSRSPRRTCTAEAERVPIDVDVASAHELRQGYAPPLQSKFRVSALLRFTRPDGTSATIDAVNCEPHDANIRGAICAERAALCRFQKEEAASGSQVERVVCATDCKDPIYPGPLCREFLTATCGPDTEVIATGTDGKWVVQPLRELLPMPSLYRRRDQDAMKALGAELGDKVQTPTEEPFANAYKEAVARARRQKAQAAVFPVLFAAAVRFRDGRVHAVSEMKGIEYGCTVDAVSLLLPELVRVREDGGEPPEAIVQTDNYGLAHAPFAAARSLLVEHGFGDILVCAHDDTGNWTTPITARESCPLILLAGLPSAAFTLFGH
eukprot:TRINITY_DN10855_c0_g1_i1.p1 TRINITY_DN10855_c0_g1~~TRINITY_DN10855_c0_g1_i1.p1  ORF type:complete len:327 (+),score=47.78 TRINITY_DN10855_c0_g1_i1:86-1066(+)